MSIVVEGLGELCTLDLFTVPPDAPRGEAAAHFDLPRGTVWRLHKDEGEAAWPREVFVRSEREDGRVAVSLLVDEPADFLLIAYLRWGQDQRTVRVRAGEGIRVLLDGQPRRELVGYAIDRPGDPSRDPAFRRLDTGDEPRG